MRIGKLKAGALQLTMFITVVIALLLAAFIVLVHTQKTFKVQTDFALETIENTNKGIQYTLQNDLTLGDTISVNLEDGDYKTLKVHRNFWGIFEKVISISTIKHKTFKKIALVGAEQPEMNRTALYLKDNNRPLVLVGNTKIEGLAYLPKQGVRTGNISGHSYYGDALIYGSTKTSGELPKITQDILEEIENISSKNQNIDPGQFLDLSKKRAHQNSFYNPVQIIYSPAAINLSEVSLIGNILVQSETKIVVDTYSNLKDVILIAPEIEVKNQVEGIFQAFATKEISVGKNCKFSYPSALVLNDTKENTNNAGNNKEIPIIKVGKGTNLKGIIVYLGSSSNYKAQVFIEEDASITGEVYSNRNLELLGAVYGSVFTFGFVANQSGSSYQNHIYNGAILIDNLPKEYVGLSFENSKKGIAKWLY